MVFAYEVDTPAGVSKDDPQVTELQLAKGVIHHWEILFPAGHWGELKLQIRHGSETVLPVNPEGWLSGDNFVFQGDDFIFLRSSPFILTAYTYNEDTNYNHKVFIHVFIKPLWTFTPYAETYFDLLSEEELGKVI